MGNVRSEALGDDGCLDIHLPSCYDKRKSFLEASTSVVGARNVGGNESRTNMFIIMTVEGNSLLRITIKVFVIPLLSLHALLSLH